MSINPVKGEEFIQRMQECVKSSQVDLFVPGHATFLHKNLAELNGFEQELKTQIKKEKNIDDKRKLRRLLPEVKQLQESLKDRVYNQAYCKERKRIGRAATQMFDQFCATHPRASICPRFTVDIATVLAYPAANAVARKTYQIFQETKVRFPTTFKVADVGYTAAKKIGTVALQAGKGLLSTLAKPVAERAYSAALEHPRLAQGLAVTAATAAFGPSVLVAGVVNTVLGKAVDKAAAFVLPPKQREPLLLMPRKAKQSYKPEMGDENGNWHSLDEKGVILLPAVPPVIEQPVASAPLPVVTPEMQNLRQRLVRLEGRYGSSEYDQTISSLLRQIDSLPTLSETKIKGTLAVLQTYVEDLSREMHRSAQIQMLETNLANLETLRVKNCPADADSLKMMELISWNLDKLKTNKNALDFNKKIEFISGCIEDQRHKIGGNDLLETNPFDAILGSNADDQKFPD